MRGDIMKSRVSAWLWAFVMGILIPGLMFAVVDRFYGRPTGLPQGPEETTKDTQHFSEKIQQVTVLQNGDLIQMDIDTYLTGVLLAEMPAGFHEEALKAQAVVARTLAVKTNTIGGKHPRNAICTSPACCQGYCAPSAYLSTGGTEASVLKVRNAVTATDSQVLTYNGTLIEATYFSCSGGRTEDALAVWGTDIPYLQSVESPGEENATHYADTLQFTASEFAQRLGLQGNDKPSAWLGTVTYTDGGGVDTMVICGEVFRGTQIRSLLGLRSTAFAILVVGDTIHISTRGFGHRVGMSQYGAEAMAVTGRGYQQILSHYYTGAIISVYPRN
jgi:stage II sporulation protein D